MQSRRFQGLFPEFQKLGIHLVGVSVDTEAEQKLFREVCSVTFPLISDTGFKISEAYGLLKTITLDGEPKHYANRETFLIDPHHRVAMHWKEIDPNTHAQEVLARVSELLGFPA
jgi:thioredoxin-dependent peroxiredoxin